MIPPSDSSPSPEAPGVDTVPITVPAAFTVHSLHGQASTRDEEHHRERPPTIVISPPPSAPTSQSDTMGRISSAEEATLAEDAMPRVAAVFEEDAVPGDEVTPLSRASSPESLESDLGITWNLSIWDQKHTEGGFPEPDSHRDGENTRNRAPDGTGTVRLYSRYRVGRDATRMDWEVCTERSSPGEPGGRYLSCIATHSRKAGVRTKIGRWAFEKCLKASMKHNVKYACGCNVPRLAARDRESVPLYTVVDGREQVLRQGFAKPVRYAMKQVRSATDSVISHPRGSDGDQEQGGPEILPLLVAEPAMPLVAVYSREEKPGRKCCDSGCAEAELMAKIHGLVCKCDGLGRRQKWHLMKK